MPITESATIARIGMMNLVSIDIGRHDEINGVRGIIKVAAPFMDLHAHERHSKVW